MDARVASNMSDMTINATSTWLGEDNSTQSMKPPDGCVVIPLSTFQPWNNPEDLISFKTRVFISKINDVYLLSMLVLVCVPTNMINMVVFCKHGLKERINLCLFSLAFNDLICILSVYFGKLDKVIWEITGGPRKLVGPVTKFNLGNNLHFLQGTQFVSGFLSTLIAFERCLCVVSPLKAQRVMQTRMTAIIIVLSHVLILAGYFVMSKTWAVVCTFDPLTGQTIDIPSSSQFYRENKELVDVFSAIIYGILLPGLFILTVLIVTVITVLKLRQMAVWREQSSSTNSSGIGSASRDVTLTRMLIGTSILFIVSLTPSLILRTALPFVPELSLIGKYYNTYIVCIYMTQLLASINSSFNFFVYYIFGTKFRHTVQLIFCKARLATASRDKKKAMDRSTMLSSVS